MSFHNRINQLSFWLAKKHNIPKPPPLGRKQTRTAETEITRNNLSIEEYLRAAAQLWTQTLKREQVYPKPYLLLSPAVIATALLTRSENEQTHQEAKIAIEKTLNDWVFRFQALRPTTPLKETIGWLEWEGIHNQFPKKEYSNWKNQRLCI